VATANGGAAATANGGAANGGATPGNEELEVALDYLEEIQVLEGDIQEAEPGESDTISVSLAGIVYSVQEHHPFTKVNRSGALTAAQKAAFAKTSVAKFPKPDECIKPKAESRNFKEGFDQDVAELEHINSQINDLKAGLKKALTEQQAAQYNTSIHQLKNRTKSVESNKEAMSSKERKVKVSNSACFLPSLQAKAAAKLGVKDNSTSVEDPVKGMCNKWNGTAPTCCKQECSLTQIGQVVTDLKVTISDLSAKEKKTNDQLTTASEFEKGALKNIQTETKKDLEIMESNIQLANSAEKGAKEQVRAQYVSQDVDFDRLI